MPRRSRQFDWNLPVEGRLPEAEWQGYHPLEELPQLLNPAAGFLQNCNSTPFLMTDRGNPRREDYPGYMAPEEDTPRARRSRQILTGQPRFTFEEWTRFATDTAVIEAEAGIAQLVEEWERLKREDEARAEDLKPVLLELKAWDRVARLDSAATTLFLRWFEAGRASRPESSGPSGATQTDATLAGAPFPALRRLEQVVVELERDFDDWRVAWGEVNRLQRIFTSGEAPFRDDRPSLPVAGGPGSAGLIFTYNTRAEPGQRRRYGVSGNSWVAVVEFGARVRARSVLVFGQSADPASPHHLDQAQLYADGQFKPVLFHSEEVRAGARRSYRP
jgi:acyl-homoserine lactone acylase PvdQ